MIQTTTQWRSWIPCTFSIDEVVEKQEHLNAKQRAELHRVLSKFEKLFDGTLGVYPHWKFRINLLPDAKPKHSRPYAIPRIYLEAFKKELMHLVAIGVLSPQGASEWGSLTFIMPKKDGRVHWVSDLQELNKVIRCKQYPLLIACSLHARCDNCSASHAKYSLQDDLLVQILWRRSSATSFLARMQRRFISCFSSMPSLFFWAKRA
jgi:hypothetical protein